MKCHNVYCSMYEKSIGRPDIMNCTQLGTTGVKLCRYRKAFNRLKQGIIEGASFAFESFWESEIKKLKGEK